MKKWARALYQPCLPLGETGKRVTGCQEHIQLSRQVAAEGMVLLKNEGRVLPLAKGTKVALFGKASVDYVKGGGGSGNVHCAYARSLQEGFEIKEAEEKVKLFTPLGDFYKSYVNEQYKNGMKPGRLMEPVISDELVQEAKAWADVAVIPICRFSGEEFDRGEDDFYLTEQEIRVVETVTSNFDKVIVVLNVGGIVDTSWFKDSPKIQAALLAWQGGMEGGLAAADILCGDVNPSGKLTDTFAGSLTDYPSSDNFHESEDYVDYTEDIYVGYRYFETIPEAADKVNYPFGYGLSYTKFKIKIQNVQLENDVVKASVCVTNTGTCSGKEVIQLYYSAPQGKLGKPSRVLGDFAKTSFLKAGESQILELKLQISNMASYDDTGKVAKSAYVLEAGTYTFWIGNSVRKLERIDLEYTIQENIVVRQLSAKCVPYSLEKRLLSDGSYEMLPTGEEKFPLNGLVPQDYGYTENRYPVSRVINPNEIKIQKENRWLLEDVIDGKVDLDTFLKQMSDYEVALLLGGQPNTGVANTCGMGNMPEYGIPNIMTADGPAGLRIKPICGIYTTAWPCATLLACTWDTELVSRIGAAGADEVKENNLAIWLTPAMNIHRNPLCGRNFEYYSEDPLISGKMGAAKIRGIQSRQIGASMKHLCCNNKETNRKDSDSRVSERALREIYLKGFEIAVKESSPWTTMSSYNLMNGCPTACNTELLTGILREEWGYDGLVTSDWWNHSEHYMELKAGNDIKMACGYPERILEAMDKGIISREEIEICAKRVLQMIMKVE